MTKEETKTWDASISELDVDNDVAKVTVRFTYNFDKLSIIFYNLGMACVIILIADSWYEFRTSIAAQMNENQNKEKHENPLTEHLLDKI